MDLKLYTVLDYNAVTEVAVHLRHQILHFFIPTCFICHVKRNNVRTQIYLSNPS